MKRGLFLVFAIVLHSITSTTTYADTITVTTTADAIANNGECSLREAIINANSNTDTYVDCESGSAIATDIINLPSGTYCLDKTGTEDDTSIAGDLDISESLTIQGAGSNLTILDAGSAADSESAGCSTPLNERIFHITQNDGNPLSGGTFTFSGLTVRGGLSTHATFNRHGAGMYMNSDSSTFNLSDVSFIDNKVTAVDGDAFGGALSIGSYTSFEFENVSFIGNSVTSSNALSLGGAIYLNSGSVGTITGILAQENAVDAAASSSQSGGFLYLSQSANITLTNATLISNSADGADAQSFGAAIYVASGSDGNPTTLTLKSATITDNSARYGGGIYDANDFTEITVLNTVFKGNIVNDSGSSCFGTIDSGNHNIADNTEVVPFLKSRLLASHHCLQTLRITVVFRKLRLLTKPVHCWTQVTAPATRSPPINAVKVLNGKLAWHAT